MAEADGCDSNKRHTYLEHVWKVQPLGKLCCNAGLANACCAADEDDERRSLMMKAAKETSVHF